MHPLYKNYFTRSLFHENNQFDKEINNCFIKNWIFVGMLDQLPSINTWFTYEDKNMSLIITRGKDDRVHAFLNSCMHRGSRICNSRTGKGPLICPYHNWTYNCSGKLLGVPKRQGFGSSFDKNNYNLHSFKTEVHGTFIFVQQNNYNSLSLDDYLSEVSPFLKNISENNPLFLFEIQEEIQANWKLVISGALEDYHIPFVHKKSIGQYYTSKTEIKLYNNGHSSFSFPIEPNYIMKSILNFLNKEKTEESFLAKSYSIFPNFLVIKSENIIQITRFMPINTKNTLRISRIYFDKSFYSYKLLKYLSRKLILPLVRKTYNEDKFVVEEVHRGTYYSQDTTSDPTHAQELRIKHFIEECLNKTK